MDDEIVIRVVNELRVMNFLKFMELQSIKDFKASTIKKLYNEYIGLKEIIWKE